MNKKPASKIKMHPRNKHLGNYDFDELVVALPELKKYVKLNNFKQKTIDFLDPKAVLVFNKALLKKEYGIEYWDIPQDFLCPPIPGRADYIHHLADLMAQKNTAKIPSGENLIPHGNKIKILDVGVGANCIYPIIGVVDYGWSFVGVDINATSLKSAEKIVLQNPVLKENVELRIQSLPKNIFKGIIWENDIFDATLCNPPFHVSKEDAAKGSIKKMENLQGKKSDKLVLNFGGQHNELWYEGGEMHFVKNMIIQSKTYAQNCFWFTTLISKESSLPSVYQMLKKAGVSEHRTIKMAQGNKQSRLVAWTFLEKNEQNNWVNMRWGKN